VLIAGPNRRGFMRELEALIARVSRYGEGAAMLFVDIDGLKRINDSYGHKAGDEALIHSRARRWPKAFARATASPGSAGTNSESFSSHADA
jgi:diguanylate cyclase (GGDEF)-like protein